MEGGPPVFRANFSCSHVLRIPLAFSDFTYRILTFYDGPSHALRFVFDALVAVLTPTVLLRSVWPPPLSLAATRGISVDFSSSGYLDVSLPRVPRTGLFIHPVLADFSSVWFPNSEIHGSTLIYSSPWLIAVSRVLLRLLMPRHSPYALFSLNFASLVKVLLLSPYQFSELMLASCSFSFTRDIRRPSIFHC